MQDVTATTPQTPTRAIRVPVPNRTSASGIHITNRSSPAQPADQRDTQLQQQLLLMQQQIDRLTSSLSAQQNQGPQIATQPHLSREYWAQPIDKSVKYPGEDASQNAKTAYLQRLDSYISKSPLIWDLVSGASKCPIATDPEAMTALKTTFGQLWEFKPKDIKRCLEVLEREQPDIHNRVLSLLNDGATSASGSWSQRNAALYSVVCDTLDLSKNGNDLGFLEVVDESNGIAIYNLARFRLREIKSSDPLARAIKLQMGIQHIKYVPKPHGVAQYFARIEKHRSELAALPKPKIISDWEVTAKALRELPELHPQFKAVAELLAIQRKIMHTETTLEDCRHAFTSADIDHNIGSDLHAKNQTKSKRKLKTNLAQTDTTSRTNSPHKRKRGKYKIGDCIHHPKSNTHLTRQCTNPFGLRSAFGLAVSYTDKCNAVKASVTAGWSPKATNVRIPQGYGCDPPTTTPATPIPSMPHPGVGSPRHLHTNIAAVSSPSQIPHQQYMGPRPSYHHEYLQPFQFPRPPRPLPHHYSPRMLHHQSHRTYARPRQPFPSHGPPQTRTHLPFPTTSGPQPPHPHMPAPLHANTASMTDEFFPPPTQDDLIAAGMRYFATQSGSQDFQ